MRLFSTDEQARVSDAISRAERKTSGEIVVVVAAQSDNYLYVPPLVGALASLLVPWILIFFTRFDVESIYLAQLAVFLILTALILPLPIRTALVPGHIKRLHAHRRAIEQFLVQNLHTTSGHTGVLIFVSVAERHAEIRADTAIDARVPPGTWKAIVDELTAAIAKGQPADGLIAAITASGEHLAQYFPPDSRNPNELPDHLIILQ
jgi:putative membrane protein